MPTSRLFLAVALLPLLAQQPSPITAKDVFYHLTRTITWYQHLTAVDANAAADDNLLLRSNARESAKRVMLASFTFARAQAAILGNAAAPATNDDAGQTLQQSLSKTNARVARLEDLLESIDTRINGSTPGLRAALVAERSAIFADLTLAKEMQTAVKNMTSFSSPKGKGAGGLLEQINLLESVNPITDSANPQKNTAAPETFHAENAGVLVLISKAFTFHSASKSIERVRAETDTLLAQVNQLRAPLRVSVRAIATASDQIADSDSSDAPTDWRDTGKRIAALSGQFKQLSTVLLPLSEVGIHLQSTRGALDEWRSALNGEYQSSLRYLLLRVGVLGGGLVFILLVSAIWQRAIFRYVQDARRRRQFLVAKRLVVGSAAALLLILGFFSSFSSVATLLGFVTAGLALALQNVILSAVAYFFLVGRYGLRVGDRVTVQGVTGQVIEVGLVRLFLMELVGSGTEMHPTGRLAVFANSVIFQPSALMKQAPGMDYTWHTVATTIEDSGDHTSARERLTSAVKAVYESYRQAIDRQHRVFERSTDMQTSAPSPVSRAQFNESGFEIVIRYPVSLAEPGDIDEQILDCLLAEAGREPKLKFTPGGAPKIGQVA